MDKLEEYYCVELRKISEEKDATGDPKSATKHLQEKHSPLKAISFRLLKREEKGKDEHNCATHEGDGCCSSVLWLGKQIGTKKDPEYVNQKHREEAYYRKKTSLLHKLES